MPMPNPSSCPQAAQFLHQTPNRGTHSLPSGSLEVEQVIEEYHLAPAETELALQENGQDWITLVVSDTGIGWTNWGSIGTHLKRIGRMACTKSCHLRSAKVIASYQLRIKKQTIH